MRGITIIAHSENLAKGLVEFLQLISPKIPMTYAGGDGNGNIGSQKEMIKAALEANEAEKIFAFYDLGSTRTHLDELKSEIAKDITICRVAMVEGAFQAAIDLDLPMSDYAVEEHLLKMSIKK